MYVFTMRLLGEAYFIAFLSACYIVAHVSHYQSAHSPSVFLSLSRHLSHKELDL